MMACFTDSDSSLDLILTVDSNRFQMQIAHLKWTLDLLSAHCNWDNEGIHTPGHGTAEKPIVPLLLVPNKWEAHMQTVVIPTPFTWFGCKYPQIKADSLQLKHILFVHLKSIVMVYRAKNVRIVSMSQYLWTWLYVIYSDVKKVSLQPDNQAHFTYSTQKNVLAANCFYHADNFV